MTQEEKFASEIQLLFKRHASLSAVCAELFEQISATQKSIFPSARQSILSLGTRTGLLSGAVINECRSQNVYAAGVLMRSLIEHTLLQLYIHVRTLKENSDSVGVAYLDTLRANEDLNAFQKMNNFNTAASPQNTKWNTKGDENKRISDISKQFEVIRMSLYLLSSSEETIKRGVREQISSDIRLYTTLSSSVHGGPFAAAVLSKSQKAPSRDLLTFATESCARHKAAVQTIIAFCCLQDAAFSRYFEKVHTI